MGINLGVKMEVKTKWISPKSTPSSLRPILVAIRDGKRKGSYMEENDVDYGIYDPYIGFCNPKKGWEKYRDVVAWMYLPDHPNLINMKNSVEESRGKR